MHYKNGRLAQVGDPVVGTCYNTNGLVVGTLVEITPARETCNCKVAFVGDAVTPVKVDYSQCSNFHHAEDAKQAIALLPELYRGVGELREKASALTALIERCGASEDLTKAVVMADELRAALNAYLPE